MFTPVALVLTGKREGVHGGGSHRPDLWIPPLLNSLFTVVYCHSLREARRLLDLAHHDYRPFRLAVLEYETVNNGTRRINGLRLAQETSEQYPEVVIVIVTTDPQCAVRAHQAGFGVAGPKTDDAAVRVIREAREAALSL